jgi:hypothetical protein
MKQIFTLFNILFFLLIGSSAVMAQDHKSPKEFRPISIVQDIDQPEGMAVIGNELYISQYHKNGSILKYDIANQMVLGKVIEGLNYPSGMLALNNRLIVLEYGTGNLLLVHPKTGQKELMASGFSRPAAVILFKDQLLVSDFGTGIIYKVDPNTYQKSVFASGLASPAGLAVLKDEIFVVEWGMSRISNIKADGTKEILATEGLSSPWGLMVYDNELYVAENTSNEISKIKEVKIPIQNSKAEELKNAMNSAQDSISVWKVISMNCTELQHPEAFSVSERGIYVSEWKSKEVSEIRLNSPPTGELVLDGKAKIGKIVNSTPQNIEDEDGLGPFSYRWQIAESPEAEIWTSLDGDKMEYKLNKGSLVGQYIRAVLNYTDQKGFEEQVFSEAKLIIKTLAPIVTLELIPDNILVPGDTVTLIATLTILDEDATPTKVEFSSEGLPLISIENPPYRYRFVVQDNKTTTGYIEQLSIVAKGYDSNGLFGTDEKSVYVTNEKYWESELLSLLNAPDEDISIFPNPANDILNIVHKSKESFKVKLINLNKQIVLTTTVTNGTKTLDVSKLTPGIYVIEYTIGTETKAQKIIIL